MSTVHVVPVGDLIEHDSSGEADCVCGPTTEPVPRDDGTFGWVVTHHSLDGREAHEEQENTAMFEPTGPKHEAPAPVPGSPAETRQDARTRGLRTLGQTVIGAVPAGLILVVGTVVTDLLSTGEAVTVAALVQALVPPVAAYLWRRWEGPAE